MQKSMCYCLLVIIIICFTCSGTVIAEQNNEKTYLIAVSLKNVKKALDQGGPFEEEARNLAWMTTPKSIVVDEKGDLILVGERDSTAQSLSIDDLAVACKNVELLGGENSPGVSIEPERDAKGNPKHDTDWLQVRYTGNDVENTRMGRVFFEIDVLLKLLAAGYEPLGLEGIPNEWDLDLHRIKSGYRTQPWIEESARSFFFPTHVKVVSGEQCSYLHSVRISVLSVEKTESFHRILKEHDIPDQVIEKLQSLTMDVVRTSDFSKLKDQVDKCLPDDDRDLARYKRRILRIAKKTMEKAQKEDEKEKRNSKTLEPADEYLKHDTSPITAFAGILTYHYHEIEDQYPVLKTYRNITGLLALLQSTKDMSISSDLKAWLDHFPVTYVETPKKIPVVQRGIKGVAVSFQGAGGIIIHPLVYRARAGSPKAIKEMVLRYRPASDTLSWLVPLGKDTNPELPISPEYETENILSLGEYFLKQGFYQKAVDLINTGIEGQSECNKDLLTLRASAYYQWGKREEAQRDIKRVLQENPEDAAALELNKLVARNLPLSEKEPFVDLTVDETGWVDWDDPHIPGQPIETPGWNPSTAGSNLLEFVGELDFGGGHSLLTRPDQLYVEPPQEIFTVSYQLSSRLALGNRFEFRVTAPFEYKLLRVPKEDAMLPANEFESVGGLSNISLSSRFLLLKGLWNTPSLAFDIQGATPVYSQFLGEDSSEAPVQFGLDGWNLYLGPSSTIPLGRKFVCNLSAYLNYSDIEAGSDNEEREQETAYYFKVEPTFLLRKAWAWTVGLGLTAIKKEDGTTMNYEIFLDSATKNRISRNSVGVYVLEDNETFVYYKISFAPELLFFRKSKWF